MENNIQVSRDKIKRFLGQLCRTIWKVGHDDPRKVIHALKVGLSLTLVSLLFLVEQLFEGIGRNAIWAGMTVVVVFEFTAGETLCKGLNRGLGTLLAGSLAFFIEYVANDTSRAFQAIFIGASLFFTGAIATYLRFFPCIQKNYDYGVVIFLLTFNLITVSSYRVDNVLKMANERVYTIAIGLGICLSISHFVCPVWSGEDLHNSTVLKLEGLAKSIEACVNGYFKNPEPKPKVEDHPTDDDDDDDDDDLIYKDYKAVLESKYIDETLARHASWEPRHSIHNYRLPWQRYVKLGAVLRRFGYTVVALHGCLRTEVQTPRHVRDMFKQPCIQLAKEVSKALMELANSMRNRRHCSPMILSDRLHEALHDLNKSIKSQPRLFLGPGSKSSQAGQNQAKDDNEISLSRSALIERESEQSGANERKVLRAKQSKVAIMSLEFSEALPFAAFASLLVETVARLDNVTEEVEGLGRVARFEEYSPGDDIVVPINVAQNQIASQSYDI